MLKILKFSNINNLLRQPSKSKEDGSDLSALVARLFKVLNQSSEQREDGLPDYLSNFPYVNGSLFKDDIQVPSFTRKSRRILLECK